MSSRIMYQHADGAPRYGIRTLVDDGALGQATRTKTAASPDTIARQPAGFGRAHLAAAADYRLSSKWADTDDPLLVELRAKYPAELQEAREIVRAELGTDAKWLDGSAKIFYRNLKPVTGRRRAAGKSTTAMFQRLGLFVLLVLPPLLLVINEAPLAWLLASGIVSAVLAIAVGEAITARLRVPVAPQIRRLWLKELRRDITDATLLAVLAQKDIEVGPRTAEAAGRGWQNIRYAAKTIDRLH
jgi:hypothetical protein